MQHVEGRLSRLERAYEQAADRLNGIDGAITDLRREVDQKIGRLSDQVDRRFNWVIGLIVTSWMTTILTVLLHRS
jgi:tetrahydromethanopterin S-methyltransferase subunit G